MGNKFSITEMCEHSQELFGVYPEVIRGAVLGKEGEYTIAEMKDIINEFMNKEVK